MEGGTGGVAAARADSAATRTSSTATTNAASSESEEEGSLGGDEPHNPAFGKEAGLRLVPRGEAAWQWLDSLGDAAFGNPYPMWRHPPRNRVAKRAIAAVPETVTALAVLGTQQSEAPPGAAAHIGDGNATAAEWQRRGWRLNELVARMLLTKPPQVRQRGESGKAAARREVKELNEAIKERCGDFFDGRFEEL